jgi:hypothetical protein
MSFSFEKNDADRFIAARRWKEQSGIPRFVFVKVPVERKPFYVDFDSPICCDILAKMVRRTKQNGAPDARISVTEMLPLTEQSWLPDAEGRHYTSELRMVAVDRTG